MSQDQGIVARVLDAFISMFSSADKRADKKKQATTSGNSRTRRHVAGHWPVWIELSKRTQEAYKPADGAAFTLIFSADADLLRSLKIKSREFNGSYIAEKKSFLVQIPERLLQELMRHQNEAHFVDGYINGEALGSRRFTLPLVF